MAKIEFDQEMISYKHSRKKKRKNTLLLVYALTWRAQILRSRITFQAWITFRVLEINKFLRIFQYFQCQLVESF